VDILPAGPQQRKVGYIRWPESGNVMSLAGFDLVFDHSIERELFPGFAMQVIPPVILVLLKLFSYGEKREERLKDLDDAVQLTKLYDEDSERLFSSEVFEASLEDFALGSAFLLGSDLSTICDDGDRVQLAKLFEELFEGGRLRRDLALLNTSEAGRQEMIELLLAFAKGFARGAS
jgi:predicted nucleotidyltransferase